MTLVFLLSARAANVSRKIRRCLFYVVWINFAARELPKTLYVVIYGLTWCDNQHVSSMETLTSNVYQISTGFTVELKWEMNSKQRALQFVAVFSAKTSPSSARLRFCLRVCAMNTKLATNCASRLSDYWVPMLLPSFYCRATCACKFATNRHAFTFFPRCRRRFGGRDTWYTKFVAGNVFDCTWR